MMPGFLRTAMGTSTYPDRSLDCWITPVNGTVLRLVVVMVRGLYVIHRMMVGSMMPMVGVRQVIHRVISPLVMPLVRVLQVMRVVRMVQVMHRVMVRVLTPTVRVL